MYDNRHKNSLSRIRKRFQDISNIHSYNTEGDIGIFGFAILAIC